LRLGGRDLHTLVFQSGRPARIDDYGETSDAASDIARKAGVRSAAGMPIRVEGRLWGVVGVAHQAAGRRLRRGCPGARPPG
jgi:GAF domain-containing protein